MAVLKFIAGMAIEVLLAIFLPYSLSVWLRLGIVIMGGYLVIMGSDILYGNGVLGVVSGGIALAMLSGVMTGLWWFYWSIFDPLVNRLAGNYNMGIYLLYAVIVLAFVVGLTMMLVSAIVMYKKDKCYQKDKSEAERQADELIQQKLVSVKGNGLKKEIIGQKMKRQYVEQKMRDQTFAHKQSVSKWNSVYCWGHVAFVAGVVPIGFVLLFCLWWWLTM